MKQNDRIYWIDSLRGLAIVMMLVFHFVFNLDYLQITTVELFHGFWLYFARFIQFTFLILVGLSMYLNFQNKASYSAFLSFQLKRAAKLFAIALLISLVSFLIIPDAYIRFGVIHLISVSIAVSALLIKYPRVLAVLAILIPIPSALIASLVIEYSLLIPFGVISKGFYTVDYFPILPWISLVFSGIVLGYLLQYFKLLGNAFYPKRLKFLENIGKKSLWIYLLHQPVLLFLIWIIF